MHESMLPERIRPLLGIVLVSFGVAGAVQAQSKSTSEDLARHPQPQPISRSDSLLRLHPASFSEKAAYDSVRLSAFRNGARTVWVGEPVLTIRPGQIRRLAVEEHRSGAPVLVVNLDSTATRSLLRVTGARKGTVIATSIGGEVFQAQKVKSPVGQNPPLFNVPIRLQSVLIGAVWKDIESRSSVD